MSSSITAPNNTITNRDGLLLAYNTINAPGGQVIIGGEALNCANSDLHAQNYADLTPRRPTRAGKWTVRHDQPLPACHAALQGAAPDLGAAERILLGARRRRSASPARISAVRHGRQRQEPDRPQVRAGVRTAVSAPF